VAQFLVVVSDQVFPDVDTERELIEAAGGELQVARDNAHARELMRDADAVLNTYLPFDKAAIASLRRAKIIARYGIGVDNIDIAAASAAGITVTNVPDYCVQEVATHTVALLLALIRRIPQGQAIVRAGGWGVSGIGELHRPSALTIGLLGCGRIGLRVARAVDALGTSVIVHDPYVTELPGPGRLVGLDELLAGSDVLCVHCPLTEQTRGLVNAAAIGAMRAGSYLVNTSRGPIVVLKDVLGALRTGQLAGAGLDVFDPEPPEAAELSGVPNLIVTPHMAFLSAEALRESQRKAVTQVLRRLRGEPVDYKIP
jgi:D-3-phosphoglycerate dehydrogenase / 2-oxoglutarate reductase